MLDQPDYYRARTPLLTLARARALNSALSPDLEHLLASLLEPDRARRPASAGIVAAYLARWDV